MRSLEFGTTIWHYGKESCQTGPRFDARAANPTRVTRMSFFRIIRSIRFAIQGSEATERRTGIAGSRRLLIPPMPVKRFRIHGRVQGVGFRFFTRRTARSLGLSGFVRNLPDGSVEAVVEGDDDRLTALERELHRGPTGARVERVETSDHPSGIGSGDFEIR